MCFRFTARTRRATSSWRVVSNATRSRGSFPPGTGAIEASGSAHYWARVLTALGHQVGLIPAAYVKPFVRRNETDAHDAATICEAVRRPTMRFIRIKTEEQPVVRGLENARDMLVRQRTQLTNAISGLPAELGIVAAPGLRGFRQLAARSREDETMRRLTRIPGVGALTAHAIAAIGDGRQFRSARDFVRSAENWRATGDRRC